MDNNLLIQGIVLIITAVMVILMNFDFVHKKIYVTSIIPSLGMLILLMIWANLLPSTFIIIVTLIIGITFYMIMKEK
jgi:hypothetical protein